MQVFELLGKGLGSRKIGETLGINLKTVHAHCAKIKEKLNLPNATALLREALRFHDRLDK